MAARVGFEPATLQTQGTRPTTEPPCPTFIRQATVEPLQDYLFRRTPSLTPALKNRFQVVVKCIARLSS